MIFTSKGVDKEQFQIRLNLSDGLYSKLMEEITIDLKQEPYPSLHIEVYLLLRDREQNQAVVIQDRHNGAEDVANAPERSSTSYSSHLTSTAESDVVVLERWTISMETAPKEHPYGDVPLPTVYKMATVLFRSLYTHVRLLPVFRDLKKYRSSPQRSVLTPRYRIFGSGSSSPMPDARDTSLWPDSADDVEIYDFEPIYTSKGPWSISVKYRTKHDLVS